MNKFETLIMDTDNTMLHEFTLANVGSNYNGVNLYLTKRKLWTKIYDALKADKSPFKSKNDITFMVIDIIEVSNEVELTMDDLNNA